MPPGFAANLARRTATACVALPLLWLAIFRGPLELPVAVMAAVVLLALVEFYRLLEARGLRPLRLTGLLLTAAIFVEVALPGWRGAPFWPLAALLLLSATLLGGDPKERVSAAAGTLLGAVYLGALGGSVAALRALRPTEEGAWRLALTLAIVMGCDILAFFVGHGLGRHRLAPQLSPSKTVEGALGGLAGGVLGALAVRSLGLPSLPVSHAWTLGALGAALGIIGDLAESLLKRWAGVKDSGALFPGHGGMLDRVDSLLFGAPLLYYYFLYVR